MIRTLFVLLVSLWNGCMADTLNFRRPRTLTWPEFDDISESDGKLFLFDGISVNDATQSYCSKLPNDSCVKLKDLISLDYYGTAYTPSRPQSNIEDYHATRTDIIKYIAGRFNFKHYLEIGCQLDQTFGEVRNMFDYAIGVDPHSGGTHRMTSDEFFAQNNRTFDIVFVDGLHTGPQVFRDVMNSLAVLEDGGIIVLHDLNPRRRILQLRDPPDKVNVLWNGDCWRAAVALRVVNEIEIVVGDFDHGVGVIRVQTNKHRLPQEWEKRLVQAGGWATDSLDFLEAISYEEFDEHRESLLRLVTFKELRMWLENLPI